MRREISSTDTLSKIIKGAKEIVNPVVSTLGSNGTTVLISRSKDFGEGLVQYPILVTKDGYTVTEHIEVEEPTEKIGVKMIKEAAQKTVDQAGDGTTTTCLLSLAILEAGQKLIEAGYNPQQIKKGIDIAVDYVVGEIAKSAIQVKGDIEKIRQIATLAANGDKVIGDFIAEAYSKIGMNGVISVEEAKGVGTSLKVIDGFKFPRGWASPYFINNEAKGESVLHDAYILIYAQAITQFKGLEPLLQQIFNKNAQEGVNKPLVIISPDCSDIALATLVANNAKRTILSCAVNTAFLGDKGGEIMEDIAAATGGVFINDVKGIQLENVQLSQLGKADKIVISQTETLIIGGHKDKEDYAKLLNGLTEKLSLETEDEAEKKSLTERIARLEGNVALLSIGATTEVEMKEMKDRADDAVGSAKCAIEEGYVVGGGTALLKIKPLVVVDTARNPSAVKGQELIMDILKSSLVQICTNSGVDSNIIIPKVMGSKPNYGYNSRTETIEDLIEAGIIDAAKVVRCSLQNAASVATMILISKYSIAYTY